MNENELCHQSAVEQKRLLDDGRVSVLELVDAHIKRIERVNPVLNAFVTLRLDEARTRRRRPIGHAPGMTPEASCTACPSA